MNVSRLRRVLHAGAESPLVTTPGGYSLAVAPGSTDADQFESLAERGRRELESGRADLAARTLADARALWRGPPYDEFRYADFARAEIERLGALRLSVDGARLEAEIASGRHESALPELRRLIHEHPLHEGLRAQLMLALYRSGRQADALATYADARRQLRDELGLEPGAELRELERRILNQDPALEATDVRQSRSEPGRRGRTRSLWLAAAGGALLMAAAAAAALLASRDDTAPAPSRSLVLLDPATNAPARTIQLPSEPHALTGAGDDIWVVSRDDQTLLQVRSGAAEPSRTIGLGLRPDAVVTTPESVWTAGRAPAPPRAPVLELHGVVFTLAPGGAAPRKVARLGDDGRAVLAAGPDVVWFASNDDSVLQRLDTDTSTVTRLASNVTPEAMAADGLDVWAVERYDQAITHIDANGRVVGTIPFGAPIPAVGASTVHDPLSEAVLAWGSLWVSDAREGKVWRFDPVEKSVEATIQTGRGALGLVAAAGSLWVANETAGTVSRVDPATNTVLTTIQVAPRVTGIAANTAGIWVAVP